MNKKDEICSTTEDEMRSGKILESRFRVTYNDSINPSLTNETISIQNGIQLTQRGTGAVTKPTADPAPKEAAANQVRRQHHQRHHLVVTIHRCISDVER
ncbi:hypothetical protein E2C01_031766 [Portunus trituberculatus]|uniref:Uncharacterized protein n=1 Tax=Portunus trituberculatus TaxID=210409 RepID=A0A5B7EUC0_PORTR|nr:hypothetical protein [Portunus trituberculatus]